MQIRIGTRGSKLALAQTEYVKERIEKAFPDCSCEIVVVKTKGDKIQDKPLHEIGDKGLFVREIEEMLLSGDIDMAVHSMKDMPAEPVEGLVFSKSWKREDPRDVLILREAEGLSSLREHAVIGTGSARRVRQLKRLRSDLQFVNIRGNVDTRIRKMKEGNLDGLVLAAAGLRRLKMEGKITEYLSEEQMLPAPAQGILALEYCSKNRQLGEMLDRLSDEEAHLCGLAERMFLAEIGGDCHVPVGAFCQKTDHGGLRLRAVYGAGYGRKEELYYADVEEKTPEEAAFLAAVQIRRQMAGTVHLVSAGPGEAGLLTVRGRELLKQADCVIYDRLVSFELLELTRTDCERIYVGKENHHHTMRQEEINRLLVSKALEYGNVVRLKGGDAYVFGRGGEEALYLKSHGVRFSVTAGVTSAVAGPAYAGIPVTYRGISGSFHVVTAHDKKDELADIDFQAMAGGKGTNIFLMGLSKLGVIMEKLMAAGMDKDTPAAVISNAATPNQCTVVSDICHIAAKSGNAKQGSPALIVVGDVVRLRENLNFFEERPLFGRKYLVPKIGRSVSGLTNNLREQGAYVRELMTGEIVFCDVDFSGEMLKRAGWIVFTSVHGVESFFYNLRRQNLDTRALAWSRFAVVGEKTRRCLESYGILADLMPEKHDGKSLAETMRKVIEKDCTVWHMGGTVTDTDLREGLEGICNFHLWKVYENRAVPIDAELLKECKGYDGILCSCASSVRRIAGAGGGWIFEEMLCVSIGEKCTKELKRVGARRILQAQQASYEEMEQILLREQNN